MIRTTLLLLVASALAACGPVSSREHDPALARAGVVAVVLAFLEASFVSDHVRRQFIRYIYAVGFVIGTHFLYLLLRNQFALD